MRDRIVVRIRIGRFSQEKDVETIDEAIAYLKYCKKIFPKLLGENVK